MKVEEVVHLPFGRLNKAYFTERINLKPLNLPQWDANRLGTKHSAKRHPAPSFSKEELRGGLRNEGWTEVRPVSSLLHTSAYTALLGYQCPGVGVP